MKNSDGSDLTFEQLVFLINHEIAHHAKRGLLDKEQDLALNKLGDMTLPTHSRDGLSLRPEEPRRDAIKRALNEGYNDGFRDGFKEGQRRDM